MVRLTDSQPRHLCCSNTNSAPDPHQAPSCFCFWRNTMQSFDVSASRGVLYRFISTTLPQTFPPTWFRGLFLRAQGVISQSYRRLCKCQSGKASGTAQRGCAIESWLPCLPSHRWLVTLSQKHGAALSFVLAPRCLLSAVDALLASLDLVPVRYRVSFKHCLSFLPPVATLASSGSTAVSTKTPPRPPRSHGPGGLLTTPTRSIRLACPGRAGCSWWNHFSLVNEDAGRPPSRRALASP